MKKVARLMRENSLNARRRRKYIPTAGSRHTLPVCENILNREFAAETGGREWVPDTACLRAGSGWVRLAVVLDMFDRKAVGRALSDGMEAAVSALGMAVANRPPQDGLIFHSDRGARYRAQAFRDVLHARRPSARQSVSRKGNCRDNACAESFFLTLKREPETLDGKRSPAGVRQPVFLYIEAYYNRIRMHSALGHVAPNVFN